MVVPYEKCATIEEQEGSATVKVYLLTMLNTAVLIVWLHVPTVDKALATVLPTYLVPSVEWPMNTMWCKFAIHVATPVLLRVLTLQIPTLAPGYSTQSSSTMSSC